MLILAFDLEEFSGRKLGTLPHGAAWPLLKAALALVSAASKVQLMAATHYVKDVKKRFPGTGRP